MAISLGSNGHGRGGRFRGHGTLSEINIIPLVDVVMVLLIIFMLTAHVMEFGIEVEVPKVDIERETAEVLPVITISPAGELYLNEKGVNINELEQTLRERFPKAKSVYLRADKSTNWDPIAQVIARLQKSQLGINVVTQPLEGRR
jgi:biopolymer transport protein ExbD